MSRLAAALRAAGLDDVRTDDLTRALYTSDASLYRVLPRAVAFPATAEQLGAAVRVARGAGTPVTLRGAGTSVAGNAVGPGLVVDVSRHLNRVLEIDPEARTARVQPGVVLADLQRAAAVQGLRFGPDPSTHNRCTIGGMIGNDACGSRALGYGRTSDNVVGLRAVTGTGDALVAEAGQVRGFDDGIARLRDLTRGHLGVLRTEFGRFERQISGYPLHRLLPEHRFDLARGLAGTEGTLVAVTEATVRLVREPAHRSLVVLGFDDIVEAAEAAAGVLAFRPVACEGLDARIVEVVRTRRGAAHVPELPRGAAWLLVELAGDDASDVRARAEALRATTDDARIVGGQAEAARLWRIREDGAGLAGRAPSGRPAWAGWEDAAVPVPRLGGYLREFETLVAEHGLTHMPFGHFGDGCVHTRLDFGLDTRDGPARLRAFLHEAARLVARHGGSLSGEHGDGRARSELLPAIYSPAALDLMRAVKDVFDPDGVLNPGVLVRPAPLDAGLRIAGPLRPLTGLAFDYPDDAGGLTGAVHRCTGVGRCRSTQAAAGTVMCPSYVATREEKDSTRGRARVLQELVNGDQVADWRHPAVRDALDLCLSCKGCASDCPTGIDMATYKAEALHQAYRRRPRPRTHYTLGRLPAWTRLATRLPGLARLSNALLRVRWLRRAALVVAGVDGRRSVPALAPTTFRRRWSGRGDPSGGRLGDVVLFVDSFTDAFAPEIAHAAARVLEQAGYRVLLSSPDACCALTWISTGQLDAAARRLRRTLESLDRLAPGAPIVGLEPSCTAVLRHDALRLAPGERAGRVAARVRTLAELLSGTPGWTAPQIRGTRVLAQPHCHHHAVLGWEADEALLRAAGVELTRVGGCCGLAGDFGMERGHYDVSVAVAGHQLLPALDAAGAGTVVLADGFSCRTQIADLTRSDALHLAQLLDPTSTDRREERRTP